MRLEHLKKFQLSWLMCRPFNEGANKKNKKSTGGWVSENWLAWLRISKIVYGWCYRDKKTNARVGAEDVLRMTISFQALVANLMSHSGVNRQTIRMIKCLIKEFMCCVRELDLHVNHAKMNTKHPKTKKLFEAFWLKPNYMSLMNLIGMLEYYGALVNFWDGGGKGERFIQLVKPYIPRGVSEVITFFVRLAERVYKMRFLEYLDRLDGIFDKSTETGEEIGLDITNNGIIRMSNEVDAAEVDESDNEDEDEAVEVRELESNHSRNPQAANGEVVMDFSYLEDQNMSKDKTVYIYPKREKLLSSLAAGEPISGILVLEETALVAYCVYRAPGRSFSWSKVTFNDNEGVDFCGLFYSPITVNHDPVRAPPKTIEAIQRLAKMAFVGIALKYSKGGKDAGADADKHCVITNWWKDRLRGGRYKLPYLDLSLYETYNPHYSNVTESNDILKSQLDNNEPETHAELQYGII